MPKLEVMNKAAITAIAFMSIASLAIILILGLTHQLADYVIETDTTIEDNFLTLDKPVIYADSITNYFNEKEFLSGGAGGIAVAEIKIANDELDKVMKDADVLVVTFNTKEALGSINKIYKNYVFITNGQNIMYIYTEELDAPPRYVSYTTNDNIIILKDRDWYMKLSGAIVFIVITGFIAVTVYEAGK